MISWSAFAFGIVLLGAAPGHPQSQPPYMRIKVGTPVEVEGDWNKKSRIFVADDILKLPAPRRPKLRGALNKVLPAEKSIVLLGVKIKVDERTEFLDDAGKGVRFEDLRTNNRVEVTCKVDAKGNWTARKISTGKIKPSDKVKGTVTRTAFDGVPPDTFEVSGLKILVNENSDLDGPWGQENLPPGIFGLIGQPGRNPGGWEWHKNSR